MDPTSDDLDKGEPKMSLTAQLDDLFRFENSLMEEDEEGHQKLMTLLKHCEENRVKWLASKHELVEASEDLKRLDKENKDLVIMVKDARFALGKEIQSRHEIIRRRNGLRNQLNAIKDFVLSEESIGSQETRDKVLSFMNTSQLNQTISGTTIQSEGYGTAVTEENFPIDSTLEVTSVSLTKNSVEYESSANKTVEPEPQSPRRSLNLESDKMPNRLGTITKSTPYMRPNPRLFPEAVAPKLSEILSMTPLDERPHKLHLKKAFKSINCGPCRGTIGFFGAFLCCEVCRAVCHKQCKDKLALPCIPLMKPNGKSTQMVLIADFVPQTRPMVPALIVHCCNEIERRGLLEEGLYRKCGSDKEVRQLKNEILKSKRGIPALAHHDIHVLCGVVKQFLRDLDEPIVTRILWRDFVRSSDQENPELERDLMIRTLNELLTANRDTLAFVVTHLTKIVREEDNKMDLRGLAKIFGPTIVGHSSLDPMMEQILAENPKQIKVMEALFRIPEEYWKEVLTTDDSQRFSSPDRRKSNVRRFSGTVQRGSLTPMKSSDPKERLSLKPMF